MIFDYKKIILSIFALVSISPAQATDTTCQLVKQSASQSKATTSKNLVVVAISASDSALAKNKQSHIHIKQRLQAMFIEYAKNYSGYKNFQITTKSGASGEINCNGNLFYALSVEKTNIIITELSNFTIPPIADIPELENNQDIFRDFR
jgi:Na+-translocating ferredoxin:NAD+ oxidoreductase RnfG subunit